MNVKLLRGRLAPSPSGRMHLGNALTSFVSLAVCLSPARRANWMYVSLSENPILKTAGWNTVWRSLWTG